MDLQFIDHEKFAALTEPHRRELQAHCYRMMGSVHDAEDMVQETFLRAWRRRETSEGRAPLRAWLYKIATNVCLDALAKRPRLMLPITRAAAAYPDDPIPASIHEPIWLEPYPDALLDSNEATPEGRYSTHESVTLAFIAALHLLPPRQRAVLILRDVLDWPAMETAVLLDMTVPAVKSALYRARVTLEEHYQARAGGEAFAALDPVAQQQLERYVRAWETADVDLLVSLLKAEATFSMPPIPSWYRGRAAIRTLAGRTIFAGAAHGRWRLLPTRANWQPAFGLYRRAETGAYEAYGIQVVTFADGAIADIITFRVPALMERFGLAATLP
jgi:RNA polymerase sigma-70 factor (ECF subfamily)